MLLAGAGLLRDFKVSQGIHLLLLAVGFARGGPLWSQGARLVVI